jgi:putative Holliday junction resolvase
VLALDVGSRRIGLAVSDALGITAQGLDTLNRTNKRADLRLLGAVIRDYAIAEIVVGNPLRMSGDASSQSDKVAAFADDLRKHFRLPVFLWDERLTSVAANRILDEAGMSREQRKGVVDRMAAVLILQAFLEARSIQPQL